MSKKTLIAALGVAAGLGIAAMPSAGIFAAAATDSADQEIKVVIDEALDIDCTTETAAHAAALTMTSNATSSDLTTKCTVVTNAAKGYTLTVADKDSELALTNGGTRAQDRIEAVSDASAADGWSLSGNGSGSGVVASPFAISDTAKTIHYQANPTDNNGQATTVTYTFNTLADQAAGEYTDTIVYTATANV